MATTPYTEISVSGVTGTTYRSDWTINGTNKEFTLSHTPDGGSVMGFVNYLFQPASVSGTTLTFAVAPITGDAVSIFYTVTSTATASSGAVTALTIIQNAMRRINKLGAGQNISDADQAFGLSELNDIIDSWRVRHNYSVVYYYHNEYTFTTSQQSYSIGQDSADFEADRPVKIIRANLIRTADSPDTRVPLDIYEMEDYARIQAPATSGKEPQVIYYQPTYPNGTIYMYPYPEDDANVLANKIEIFTWALLSSWASTDTSVDLAPGYKDALTWTLAERLTVSMPITPVAMAELKSQARQARAGIASMNSKSKRICTRDWGIPQSEGYS